MTSNQGKTSLQNDPPAAGTTERLQQVLMHVYLLARLIPQPYKPRTKILRKQEGLDTGKLSSFEGLAQNATHVTILRQSGFGFGHAVKIGDRMCSDRAGQ